METQINDRDAIRNYLLGRLSDEPIRKALEEAPFNDESAYRLQTSIEEDLFVDYVMDRLSSNDRALFERHILSARSEERERQQHEKLQFAQAFAKYVRRESRWWNVFQLPAKVQPVVRPAAVAAAVVLLAILPWGGIRFEQSRAVIGHHLQPATSQRGEGTISRLVVPESAKLIRLELELADVEYARFQAVLSNIDSGELWRQNGILADRAEFQIILNLPAEVLAEGDFEIVINGLLDDGSVTFVDSYQIRVNTEVD